MPGFPRRAFELGDGPLSAWSQFCAQFGVQASQQPGAAHPADWLGGTAIASTPGRALRVSLNSQPLITQAAANSMRPAVWCLYRVERVPVHRRSDRTVVGEQAVPVPVSVGVAKRDALTQYPPGGVADAAPQWLWCRGWDDTRPESDKWGTAVSSAAWIVEVMQGLTLPAQFWAS